MIIGDKKELAFDIVKISEADHVCMLKVFVRGENICEWKEIDSSEKYTVCWNIDELISYLYETTDFLYEDDPFPVIIDGECASELENNARDFESDDEKEMEAYYDKLNDWVYKHSWNHARYGAVVPDVLFRKVDGNMEISWWTDQEDEGRVFTNRYGYVLIPKNEYENLIEEVFHTYNEIWQ